MAEGVFARITNGLTRSRDKFKESMNVLLDRGPDLDEGFWEELEDALVLSDVGGAASLQIVKTCAMRPHARPFRTLMRCSIF